MSEKLCLTMFKVLQIQQLTSVQFSRSVVSDSATPWLAAHEASLSITNSWSLLKLMSIESVMPSNHLILCCPLLLLPSILPSIRLFSNELALCIRWPKYWSFSFSISPSNEYSGLTSFRMAWMDLLAVQGTLKSLLQHHSSKAWVLRCSAFFLVQLSYQYMTTGNIHTWLSHPYTPTLHTPNSPHIQLSTHPTLTSICELLIKQIIWTTALSNSMILQAMPCRATQDGLVMVESSDKM